MNVGRRPRVLVADDHRMVAEGVQGILAAEFDVVGVVEDGRSLLEATKQLRPDVVVADVTMPHLNGIDAIPRLRQLDDRVCVVILTMHAEPEYTRRALAAGASGYVLKHSAPAELIAAVRAALAGKSYVTPTLAGEALRESTPGGRPADPMATLNPRQREILQLIAEGRTAKEVGAALSLSARTVEFHKYKMMETLGLRTAAELVHFAIKHGIVAI